MSRVLSFVDYSQTHCEHWNRRQQQAIKPLSAEKANVWVSALRNFLNDGLSTNHIFFSTVSAFKDTYSTPCDMYNHSYGALLKKNGVDVFKLEKRQDLFDESEIYFIFFNVSFNKY